MKTSISERGAALNKMFRERLQAVVEATGASIQSPLAADWILHELDNSDASVTDKVLAENWKLTYMITRLTEYHWTDINDLPHRFTFATRAHLLAVGYHMRNFDVADFERMMANASNKLRKN